MTRYSARLEALAATLTPPQAAAYCFVLTGDDEAAAVARFRAAREWPDDGTHPVTVIRYLPGDLDVL